VTLNTKGPVMRKKGQLETLSKNYDELEDDEKNKLLEVGEQLLNIQNLVNNESTEDEKVLTE